MFNIFNRTRLTPFPQNKIQNRKTTSNEEPLPRRRSIIREFALNTSTHALPGIARSQSKHNRIFWSISFVIFTGVMSYFVTQSIINYFQYPTQTSVSVVVERSQDFPAVTICNYSPARADLGIGPFVNYTNSRNLTNTTTTAPFTLEQASYLEDFLVDGVNDGMPIESFFFSLDIMLVSCHYNGKTCNSSDFISFISPAFGSCYTFNAKTKSAGDAGIRKTNQDGGYGRLQLRLYAHSHLYIPYITEDVAVGMVAMVHDNTELPLIDVAGMYLSSGNRYKVAYKRKSAYFLSSPYTDCTTEIPLAMRAMYSRYEGADYAYSQGVCHILCVQAYTYHECGCVSPTLWSARSVVLPGTDTVINAPLCNTSNTCFVNASNRISESDTIWNEYCSDCKRACSTSDFSVTISSVRVLTVFFAYVIKYFVELVGVPLPNNWTENWYTEVNNNYIALDVVCSSTTIENLTQEASVSPVDVLSNVGGHTGLWIGISFLSIMELVEMLYRLARLELKIIRRRINGRR